MAYKATGLLVVYNPAACRQFSLHYAAWWFFTESRNVYVQLGCTAPKHKLCLMYSIVSSVKIKFVVWTLVLQELQI